MAPICYFLLWFRSHRFCADLTPPMHVTNIVINSKDPSVPTSLYRRFVAWRLDLSRPCDVIDHTTIWFAICYFVLVFHWNRASISKGFLDICIQIYLGHDLDLLGSRDVTSYVTIWYPRCHFLQVLYCNGVCISSHFQDNGSQKILGHALTFQVTWRHRSRDHWPVDSTYVISYWCPVGTEPLSSVEIFGLQNQCAHTETLCIEPSIRQISVLFVWMISYVTCEQSNPGLTRAASDVTRPDTFTWFADASALRLERFKHSESTACLQHQWQHPGIVSARLICWMERGWVPVDQYRRLSD